MSESARPEKTAFAELRRLVRDLAGELAAARKRALEAEARVRDVDGGVPPAAARLTALERENAALRTRLDEARDRVRRTIERVRFLRQQTDHDGLR